MQLHSAKTEQSDSFVEKDQVSRDEHQYTAEHKEICITLNYWWQLGPGKGM